MYIREVKNISNITKMIRKVSILLGVAFVVCTFGSTSNNSISNVNNDTIIVINTTLSSLISNETTTKSFETDATTSTLSSIETTTEENFQLPASCSNYKVKCDFQIFSHIFHEFFTLKHDWTFRSKNDY